MRQVMYYKDGKVETIEDLIERETEKKFEKNPDTLFRKYFIFATGCVETFPPGVGDEVTISEFMSTTAGQEYMVSAVKEAIRKGDPDAVRVMNGVSDKKLVETVKHWECKNVGERFKRSYPWPSPTECEDARHLAYWPAAARQLSYKSLRDEFVSKVRGSGSDKGGM